MAAAYICSHSFSSKARLESEVPSLEAIVGSFLIVQGNGVARLRCIPYHPLENSQSADKWVSGVKR